MNEARVPNGGRTTGARQRAIRPLAVVVLAVLLFVECCFLAAAAVFLAVELVVDVPHSYAAAVAILAFVIVAAAWVGVIAVNTLRARPWIRGAALVWQVLQLSIGVGSFQGVFARPDVGWALVLPAIAAIILLFTPKVLRATRRD